MKKSFASKTALAAVLGALCFVTPHKASAELITAIFGTGNQIATFDSATPGTVSAPITVTGITAGFTLQGIDYRPVATGDLFGLARNASGMGELYTINPLTGVATQVTLGGTPLNLGTTGVGMDFNPTVGSGVALRIVTTADQNYRINALTNAAGTNNTDTNLAYAGGDVNAGQNPTVGSVAYANNVVGATTTTLFGIDSDLGVLVTINPPNAGTLNTIGALGVDPTNLTGFDISTFTGVAYAALADEAVDNRYRLYTINLATGAATSLGLIGDGLTQIRGISLATVPEPGSLALAGFGLVGVAGAYLVRRRRSAKTDK